MAVSFQPLDEAIKLKVARAASDGITMASR